MSRSKLSHSLALLALVLFAASPLLAQQDVLDGVAAVVNGEVITFSQVRELVGPQERRLRDAYRGQELIDKIKEVRMAALNDIIDRQLVLQEFKKKEFTIPEYVIDDRVQVIIREEFGGDRQAFLRTLQAQGFTLNRFKSFERDKIIVQAMRQRALKGEPIVSPQKIANYYERHRDEFGLPEQVKLRMIVLKKNGETEDRMKMIEEIRAKIVDGAEFEKMAEMYSEDSTREAGGDWGWVDRKTLNDNLTRVAFGLKAGEVSRVLELGDNLYLLYVEAKKNARTKPLDEVRGDIEKKLVQTERQRLQEKWVENLRKKAFIKIY